MTPRKICGIVLAVAGVLTAASPFILAQLSTPAGSSMANEGDGGGGAIWLAFLLVPLGVALLAGGLQLLLTKPRAPFDPNAEVTNTSLARPIVRLAVGIFLLYTTLGGSEILRNPSSIASVTGVSSYNLLLIAISLGWVSWSAFDVYRRLKVRDAQRRGGK